MRKKSFWAKTAVEIYIYIYTYASSKPVGWNNLASLSKHNLASLGEHTLACQKGRPWVYLSNLTSFDLHWPLVTSIDFWGQNVIAYVVQWYNMSMHAKNGVPECIFKIWPPFDLQWCSANIASLRSAYIASLRSADITSLRSVEINSLRSVEITSFRWANIISLRSANITSHVKKGDPGCIFQIWPHLTSTDLWWHLMIFEVKMA